MEVAPILRNWAKAFDGLAAQLSASCSSRDPASNEQPLDSTNRPNPQGVAQEAQEENHLRKRVLQSHASALRLLSERIFKSQYKPVDAIEILTEVGLPVRIRIWILIRFRRCFSDKLRLFLLSLIPAHGLSLLGLLGLDLGLLP